MVQKVQSPEGRVQQKQRSQTLGPMGVALFSPMDATFVMMESSDEADVTTRVMVSEDDTESSGAVHEELLNSKDVVSARTENSTPADDESDDDEVYLHVIPDGETVPRLLSESVMKELLVRAMPYTLHGRWWKRLCSISRDGDSFETFLNNVKGYDHTITVVQTSRGEVIGGLADEAWDRGSGYKDMEGRFFGMGTSFLFSLASSSSSEPMQILNGLWCQYA
jgi:hypothetical protein